MKRIHLGAALILAPVLAFAAACDRPPSPSRPDAAAAETADDSLWTCPMCPGVIDTNKSACPKCGMDLVDTRTQLIWSCLEHPVIIKEKPGVCPLCERDLAPINMAVVWLCQDHEKVRSLRPGKCPFCQFPLQEELELLPHGDHNPRHGGQFFMAPDQWHHLEGTLPVHGEFRVRLYDDFTRPLPATSARGRVEYAVMDDRRDGDAVDDEPPRKTVPLAASTEGEYLEARVPAADFGLPIDVTAFLRFTSGAEGTGAGDEYRFDFRFEKLTRKKAAREGVIRAIAQTAGVPDTSPQDWSALSHEELVRELVVRDRGVRDLMDRKQWGEIYRPAIEAKDLALEMESAARTETFTSWDSPRRRTLFRAIRDVVRGAWLLELEGDAGNGEKVGAAYRVFERGVKVVRWLFPPRGTGPTTPR